MLGKYLSPYLIAEIGVNHEGSLEKAKLMIDQIADIGWHCAKFQTYSADKLASKNSPAYWDQTKEPTKTQHELFKKYDAFTLKDYCLLAEHCKRRRIDFLSTPFDNQAVDELSPMMSIIKIASADLTNIPLLRKVASTGKRVVLSIGASEIFEIERAIYELEENGSNGITILHCVLNYPTPPANANLAAIRTLKNKFQKYEIGYSDHIAPDETMSAILTSILMGATVIEKHFTFDRSLPGNDHYHAFDKQIGKEFSQKLRHLQLIAGSGEISAINQRSAVQNARRSIVTTQKIDKGEKFSESNLTTKRPGTGIKSIYWDDIIGLTSTECLEEDTIVNWSMING